MPRPRVLVVNAELGTSHAIPATLTGDGYEVDLVDAADVLDRFANHRYDLLIADLLPACQNVQARLLPAHGAEGVWRCPCT